MKCSQCAMQCRLAWSLFLMELVLSIASCDLHVITVVLGRPATEQNSAKPVERSYPASLQVTATIASHPCKENSPRQCQCYHNTSPPPPPLAISPGGWCDQFSPRDYLAGQHANAKPNPAGNHLTGHSPVRSPPVTLLIVIFSFRSHSRQHDVSPLTQSSHRTQFQLTLLFLPELR